MWFLEVAASKSEQRNPGRANAAARRLPGQSKASQGSVSPLQPAFPAVCSVCCPEQTLKHC